MRRKERDEGVGAVFVRVLAVRSLDHSTSMMCTVMPHCITSFRKQSLYPSTAYLDAQYAGCVSQSGKEFVPRKVLGVAPCVGDI